MSQNTDFSAAGFSEIEKKAQRNEKIRKTVTYILLTFWSVIVLFPFYWMILTSVKSYSTYNAEYVPKLYTLAPTLQNYRDAFTAVSLGRYFVNTLIFTVVTTALMMIVTVLSAETSPSEIELITSSWRMYRLKSSPGRCPSRAFRWNPRKAWAARALTSSIVKKSTV